MIKMAEIATVVGIDLSGSWWDVATWPVGEVLRFANDAHGHAACLAWLGRTVAEGSVVACEASGGLERPVVDILHHGGYAVRVVDAGQVLHFSRAQGRKAKTDPIDAGMIARFAATFPGLPTTPDPTRQALVDLVSARDLLVAQLTASRNCGSHMRERGALKCLERCVETLMRQIVRLDGLISALIAKTPAYAARSRILRSVPGVGPATVSRLLASLPELGKVSAKRVACLVGVAPMADDSGERRGGRHIVGGRHDVRRTVYMAALVATQRNPVLRSFYEQLCARGKAKKLALIAVIRKLVVILNTMIARNSIWTDQAETA
jgi:transposase